VLGWSLSQRCYGHTGQQHAPGPGKPCSPLLYGTEVMIPADVGSPSFMVSHYNPGLNDDGIKLHLDLLQERRDEAHVIGAAYQGNDSAQAGRSLPSCQMSRERGLPFDIDRRQTSLESMECGALEKKYYM
jgi:hypothetical protein